MNDGYDENDLQAQQHADTKRRTDQLLERHKQRIQKLTVEASGIYSSAWGDKGVGPSFAKGGTAGYLNSRYFTIYGGASEVQKDIVAKKVLGLTKGSSK